MKKIITVAFFLIGTASMNAQEKKSVKKRIFLLAGAGLLFAFFAIVVIIIILEFAYKVTSFSSYLQIDTYKGIVIKTMI